MKKLHKWPSLVIAVFFILWAASGVILNHRYTFSSFDVDRDLLPGEHRYLNWNNAAIRSSVKLDTSNTIYYGNVGIWKYDNTKVSWTDMRTGLPKGADHHKVNCLLKVEEKLYCGTRFGLYKYAQKRWIPLNIPHSDKHVVDLVVIRDSLYVMTRSHLWKCAIGAEHNMRYVPISAPAGYDNKVGLFKTLWLIHSGEIYGMAGKLLVDLVALVFVFLTMSGLIYFFFPRIMKNRKKKDKPVKILAKWNKYSIKWHNKIGIWLVTILVITTFTGMFLRPPLLIAIASERVEKIPYSILDDGNPWFDRLRRILYDSQRERVYLATSEGIFSLDSGFVTNPEKVHPQPPASVMGYNVFCKYEFGGILVGSFSGLYTWHPDINVIIDHSSGAPYTPAPGPSMPISDNMTSGYCRQDGLEYVFDYNRGVVGLGHAIPFPDMPEEIRKSKMPLWNVALEMHTARLLKPLMGDLYILFIPLFGMGTLLILASGTILWIRKFNRKRK